MKKKYDQYEQFDQTEADAKANETKKKALRLAAKYLQTRGVNGFSFQDIADDLAIKKASLHYYFASKDELLAELLQNYLSAFHQWTLRFKNRTARQKLRAVVRLFADLAGKDHRICPGGALAADFQSLSSANKSNFQSLHHAQREWLTATINQGIQENSIRKVISPAETTDTFMSVIQGALQIARLRSDSGLAGKIMMDYLAGLLKSVP
ncbi:MAG: hypothetical protein C5B49_13610, partial [Bdellovibrio sp.]